MSNTCTLFVGTACVATGDLSSVALQAKAALDRDPWAQPLIFDDVSSRIIEVDLRGSLEDVAERLGNEGREPANTADDARRPGRPKLGVVAREVTLLPRHWEWLANQPGGASVALRKLVDQARIANQGLDPILFT